MCRAGVVQDRFGKHWYRELFLFFESYKLHEIFLCVSMRGAVFWTNSPFTRGGKEAHHFHSQLQALKVMFKILPFNCEAILLVSTRKKGYQHFKQLNASSHYSLRFPRGWFAIQSYDQTQICTVELPFSFFGGLMCCQCSREKLSGFGWLTQCTMSLWSLVKKARAATFFWLEIRALVNVSICMFCPYSGKLETLEIWHTSKGNTKSSNFWLDSFHQMEQENHFQWSSVCSPPHKVNLDESVYTFRNHSMNDISHQQDLWFSM